MVPIGYGLVLLGFLANYCQADYIQYLYPAYNQGLQPSFRSAAPSPYYGQQYAPSYPCQTGICGNIQPIQPVQPIQPIQVIRRPEPRPIQVIQPVMQTIPQPSSRCFNGYCDRPCTTFPCTRPCSPSQCQPVAPIMPEPIPVPLPPPSPPQPPRRLPCGTPSCRPNYCQNFPCYADPYYGGYSSYGNGGSYQDNIIVQSSEPQIRTVKQPKIEYIEVGPSNTNANVPLEIIDVQPEQAFSNVLPQVKSNSYTTYDVKGGQTSSSSTSQTKPITMSFSRTFSPNEKTKEFQTSYVNGKEVAEIQPAGTTVLQPTIGIVQGEETEDETPAPVSRWFL